MTSHLLKIFIALAAIAIGVLISLQEPSAWSEEEISVLKSLWLESLPDLPADSSNAVADDPVAVDFGRQLFFDSRLSANGGIACATCHQIERRFTDGLQKGQAIGTTDRHTPSIVGSAYSPWQFWDGRRDSQWAQALAPLEDANEHGTNRTDVVKLVTTDAEYRPIYESLFGDLPDALFANAELLNTAFANVGKSIAAFERTLMPTPSRFDDYVTALVNDDEKNQEQLLNDDAIAIRRLCYCAGQ